MFSDAGLAEVVSTGRGDRVDEDVQTDGAQELFFRQETAAGSHV